MSRRRVTVGAALLAAAIAAGAWSACGPVRRSDGGVGLLRDHDLAPDFRARDQDGRDHALAEYRGRSVVLYFYPRDGTPGCTREACAFRDAWDRLSATGAQVIGVSSDDVASHARFARQHGLRFPLLADPGGRIASAYGIRRFLGLDARITYVIGPDGRIVHVFPDVDPAVHADEVIRLLTPSTAPPGA